MGRDKTTVTRWMVENRDAMYDMEVLTHRIRAQEERCVVGMLFTRQRQHKIRTRECFSGFVMRGQSKPDFHLLMLF